MHTIGCTIDTDPMAHEMKSIGKHVEQTTAAVIGMQTAVIAAEKKAADRVCSDVNRGFHTLMLSQVSQKIAQLQSNVNSYLLRLNQLSKQLTAVKTRMERDYNRTALRYSRTFNVLNKELRKRVQEIDQPIFRFALVEAQTTSNRMNNLAATVPLVQGESVSISQQLVVSNLKHHSKEVLEASSTFVGQMEDQKILTDNILLSGRNNVNASLYIPVLFYEGQTENAATMNVQLPNEVLSSNCQRIVYGEMSQQSHLFPWHDGKINEEVKNEFSRLLNSSDKPQRVLDQMKQLMQSLDNFQTL